MKKFLVVAVAAIALLSVIGCAAATDNGGTTAPTVNYSQWKIKGSVDGWSEHKLVVSDTDSNKLTYVLDGLYQDSNFPIVYQFVLVDPAGKEYKAAGADKSITTVTPGTAFVLGDSSVAGSQANVGFAAAKSSYTVTVNISTATAPSVNLIAGSTVAPTVTNAVLAGKLQIKGDAFSAINGATVAAWTATNGTVATSSASWDVLVDNKIGSFGFNSMDGWIANVTIDTAGLTATSSPATTAAEVLTTGGTSANAKLSNTTKSGSVYTITLTTDVTKAVNAGRYMMTVSLKTLSTTNWAFTAWTAAYLVGAGSEFGAWTPANAIAMTGVSGVFTKQITATGTAAAFQIIPTTTDWKGQVGAGNIDIGAGSLPLSSSGDITFTAVVGTTYTITVDFTTANYIANGKPTVKVVTP